MPGIGFGALPAALNARALFVYFGSLSPMEYAVHLGVFGSIIAPITVAAHCVRYMVLAKKQRP